MNFKNLKDLEKHLNNQMKDALLQVKEEVYSIIAEKLLQYYEEYTPVKYKRTYQLLKSLVKTEVIPTGHGFKANVYFDLSKIHYNKDSNYETNFFVRLYGLRKIYCGKDLGEKNGLSVR